VTIPSHSEKKAWAGGQLAGGGTAATEQCYRGTVISTCTNAMGEGWSKQAER